MTKIKLSLLVIISLLLISCEEDYQLSSVNPNNWDKRIVKLSPKDSLETGTTYLSVYSQIYSQTEHRTHNLTVTISMRNTNKKDSVFIQNAEYFHTDGTSIRRYFDKSIFIAPMETIEIIIDELDQEGGTGANFLFDWMIRPGTHEPFFEGVMISTYGQQGLSFTTEGKRIE